MNIHEELQKAGLTEEDYEAAISDIINKLNGTKKIEWSEIHDKYHLSGTPEYLRQAVSKRPFGGAFVYEYFCLNKQGKSKTTEYAKEIDSLRKEKQRLADERAALRKVSREDARAEENFVTLEALIKKNGKTLFKPVHAKVADSDNDLIVCLSDLHIGLTAESQFGKYDSKIAKKRLNDYLAEIVNIQKTHKAQNVYVGLLGDIISGNIHPSVQLENRENVVEQIQIAGEYLSAFVYELAKHFKNVYVSDVPGNHSRVGIKDNVLRNERLDDLIVWYMKAKLDHLKNIVFVDDKYDATISSLTVRNKEYILIHGDYDAFSENGLNKLCMFIGHVPTGGVFCGHLHHCSYDDINDVKMIRSGSFAGTCDNYTIQKRLYSKPSQMVCVANKDGIQTMYPVVLD